MREIDELIKKWSSDFVIVGAGDTANKVIAAIISDGKKIASANFINYMNYIAVNNDNVISDENLSNMIDNVTNPDSIIIIAADMGDNTGSMFASAIAAVSKSRGLITIGIAVKTSDTDNIKTVRKAEQEINDFRKNVDSLIVIDKQERELLKRAILALPTMCLSKNAMYGIDFEDIENCIFKKDSIIRFYHRFRKTDEVYPYSEFTSNVISDIHKTLPIKRIGNMMFLVENGVDFGMLTYNEIMDHVEKIFNQDRFYPFVCIVNESLAPNEMRITVIATEKSDYDKVIHSQFEDIAVIDYGIIKGNETIVFIKAGQYGTIYGYKNKYLKMAKAINEKYGYTVICLSNPFNGKNPLDNAMKVIDDYCKENKLKDYTIYYMGHSNGALIGAWYGINYPRIKRMLLVNGPIQHNWHKTKNNIKKFSGEKMVFVYGSLDPSYQYTELIQLLSNDKVKLEIIEGEDHNFSKGIFDFKTLPENFLLN